MPSSCHQALSGQRKWQVMGYYSEDHPGFHTHHSKHLGYPERILNTFLGNGEILLLQASLHSIYSISTRINLFSLNEGEGREPAVSILWLQMNARMEMARDIYISPSPYHSLAEGLAILQPPRAMPLTQKAAEDVKPTTPPSTERSEPLAVPSLQCHHLCKNCLQTLGLVWHQWLGWGSREILKPTYLFPSPPHLHWGVQSDCRINKRQPRN